MIDFNIAVGYVVRKQLREAPNSYWRHDRQITEQLVREVLVRKYPQGSKESTIQGIHADIDEAFALAINEERDRVSLDRTALKHILDAAESVDVQVEMSAHVRRLREAIKNVLASDEKAVADASARIRANGVEAQAATPAKA